VDQAEQILRGKATGSAEARLGLLKQSIYLTLKNPLFGVGPGQFPVASDNLAAAAGRKGTWQVTHNTYTEISSEAGIPALIFYLGAMVTCWTQLSALRKRNRALRHPANDDIEHSAATLRILMVAIAVQFLFISSAYATAFPTIAGLVVGLIRGGNLELDQAEPAPPPASNAPGLVPART
jgi:O-antigen ligase